jgi:uncharacterized protein with PIN domain
VVVRVADLLILVIYTHPFFADCGLDACGRRHTLGGVWPCAAHLPPDRQGPDAQHGDEYGSSTHALLRPIAATYLTVEMLTTPLRFAADRMLGRLATWLRLIGQDTTYGAHLSGRTLVRHGREEGRIILTRDRRLLRVRPQPPLIFIESDHFRDQVRQVVAACQLDPFARVFTRCSRCNQPLQEAAREQVADRVPPYVFATQQRFARCPRCQRIYWAATHLDRLRDELVAMGFRAPSSS